MGSEARFAGLLAVAVAAVSLPACATTSRFVYLDQDYVPPVTSRTPELFLDAPPARAFRLVGRVEVFHNNFTTVEEVVREALVTGKSWGCELLVDYELIRRPRPRVTLDVGSSGMLGPNADPDAARRVFICGFFLR